VKFLILGETCGYLSLKAVRSRILLIIGFTL